MKTSNRNQRCLFTAVAVLAIAGPAQGVCQMISDSETLARVPMTFTRNQVRIPVSVNGSKPFTLILDTGMPTRGLLLRAGERVDALALEFLGTDSVSGGGSDGALSARVSKGQRIELGGLAIPEVPVIVLPQQNLMQEVDGVIGAELFERFAVRVDADRLQVDLIDPGIFQPAHGSSIVPLRFNQGVAFVDAEVTVDAGAPVAADLAIDLGAGHALWLNEKSNPRLASPAGAIETVLGRGLSGEIRGSIGRVHRLELGDFEFENVVTLFPVGEHQNPGGFDFRDGFIGAEILTRFVVTYDYVQKRMVLERGGMFSDPFEFDMSGMVLAVHGADSRRVDAVLKGSPAETAGVRTGDVLTAIDGRPIATLGPDGIRDALLRDGAEVRVTLQRDGATIEKTFRLRRLL